MNRLGRSTSHHSALASAIGRVGVVRQPRVDLDGDPAVHAAAAVVDRAQHVAGPPDVVGGDRAHRLLDVDPADGQVADLLVVGVAR